MKTPLLTIALIEPKIPPNTGNIARLCAATHTQLDLVGKLGFSIKNKDLKRAGLDYWNEMNIHIQPCIDTYFKQKDPNKIYLLTTKSTVPYYTKPFKSGDTLIFGSETEGLPTYIREKYPSQCITIPMENPGIRSLNLSTSAGIVLYEAKRQISQT